jgi:hypothetical protein
LHATHGSRYTVMLNHITLSSDEIGHCNSQPLWRVFYMALFSILERCQMAEMHMMNNPNTWYCASVMKYTNEKIRVVHTLSLSSVIKKGGLRCTYLPTSLALETS